MRFLSAAIAGLVAGACLSGTAAADGDAAKGGETAKQHCTRCHVVGDFNRMGGIESTPSFQLLVNAFKDYEDRFKSFYLRRPHGLVIKIKDVPRQNELPDNAHRITLTLEDVENLTVYAATLKKKKKK